MGRNDEMGGLERYEARQRRLTAAALCVGVLALFGLIVGFVAFAIWVVVELRSF